MKYLRILMILVSLGLLSISCDRKLPYPLEDVVDGVVVDICAVEGSDKVLSEGEFGDNFKAKLSIPKQQGDYSNLVKVQLLAVLQDNKGKSTAKVVQDDIKDFPLEIDVDLESIYKEFGKTAPQTGEILYLTTNTMLKNGKTIFGWTEYQGFNNKAFTGWIVDGRAYSYNIRYPVVCTIVLEEFEGVLNLNDGDSEYKVQAVKKSETELEVIGIEGSSKPVKIIIDPSDHTVSVPKAILAEEYGSYTNFYIEGRGTIDACNGNITFVGDLGVDQGLFVMDGTWKMSVGN